MRPKTGASGKRKSAALNKTYRIPGDLMRRLRREAAALKLDVSEYMTLMVHGSEVLRKSLLPEGLDNADVLRKVLGTPLLLDMVKTTAHTVIRDTVQEYLPNWHSKDVSPEQLIEWLRGLGAKKTRQGGGAGAPGPAGPFYGDIPGPGSMAPGVTPPGHGAAPPGPPAPGMPGPGFGSGFLDPYPGPPAFPGVPAGSPAPWPQPGWPAPPSAEVGAAPNRAGEPRTGSRTAARAPGSTVGAVQAAARPPIYDLPWPPPDLPPR